jgi:hypothetical protein
LYDSFAGVDPPAQHRPQIALSSAEDILPFRFVPKKGKGIRHQLPGASQLGADGRDEDRGTWIHTGLMVLNSPGASRSAFVLVLVLEKWGCGGGVLEYRAQSELHPAAAELGVR